MAPQVGILSHTLPTVPACNHRAAVTAGFGAAKHLAEQGYAVTLLDAAPEPGGLATGWRTKQGRACEAGIKGFWYEVCALPGPQQAAAHQLRKPAYLSFYAP